MLRKKSFARKYTIIFYWSYNYWRESSEPENYITADFSMNYDYGHINYLNHLQNQRTNVTKALERIERRAMEIINQKREFIQRIRQCQTEEEAHREKEQQEAKPEAALFRRHYKDVERRLKESRLKEWCQKQDAALEKAYRQLSSARMTMTQIGIQSTTLFKARGKNSWVSCVHHDSVY